MMVLAATRPEPRLQPALAAAGARVLEVGPLDDVVLRAVLESALPDAGAIEPVTVAEITGRSAGNPLMAERLCRLLVESGELRPRRGVWTHPRGLWPGAYEWPDWARCWG